MSPAESPAIDCKALVQDDRIHASLYTDPRIFADEMDRIFHAGWVFVGQDSEIPHEMHWWAGRITHRLRRVDGALRMSGKKLVLVNAAEPLPNLSFLV